jgi:hypothetical protein
MAGKYGRSKLIYVDRAPVPRDRPRCQQCGRKMPAYFTYEFHPTLLLRPVMRSFAGWGYDGNGYFCSLRCGYRYGLSVMRNIRGVKNGKS